LSSAHHRLVTEYQLDLFSDAGLAVQQALPQLGGHPLVAAVLDDQALIAAIPQSSLADSSALAAEAGRQRAPWPK
jgi:hypothetical protein